MAMYSGYSGDSGLKRGANAGILSEIRLPSLSERLENITQVARRHDVFLVSGSTDIVVSSKRVIFCPNISKRRSYWVPMRYLKVFTGACNQQLLRNPHVSLGGLKLRREAC